MLGIQSHKPELVTYVLEPKEILEMGAKVVHEKTGIPVSFGLTFEIHEGARENDVVIGAYLLSHGEYDDDQMAKLVAFGIQHDAEFNNFEVLLTHTFGVNEYYADLDGQQLSYVTVPVSYEEFAKFQGE